MGFKELLHFKGVSSRILEKESGDRRERSASVGGIHHEHAPRVTDDSRRFGRRGGQQLRLESGGCQREGAVGEAKAETGTRNAE